MNPKPLFLFIFLFPILIAEVSAQKFLLLQRGDNQKTRIKLEEGEAIVYQQRGLDYMISDVIVEIQRDFLVLKENIIRPEDIEIIDLTALDERNRTWRTLTLLPLSAGVLLLTAETVNGIWKEGQFSYSKEGLLIAGSLLLVTIPISQFRYKKFRNRGRNKLQIIYLGED